MPTTTKTAPGIEAHHLAPAGVFPNSTLPLVIYRKTVRERDPGRIRSKLEANDWSGTWQDGLYDFHHFHSGSHEVLIVCAGWADLQVGGPDGPVLRISAGDAVMLPAGTAHCCVAASEDLMVVGAYPLGQEKWDVMRGSPVQTSRAEAAIANVPLPATDPIFGSGGPLLEYWGKV